MKLQTIKIPIPKDFSFKECLWFLDRALDDCMHVVENGSVRKLIEGDDKPLLLQISEDASFLIIEILTGKVKNENLVTDYVREWFDLNRNIKPFYKLLKSDADLAFLAEQYKGFHIVGIPDLFEALCWAILGQQINLQFAYKMKRRLVELYGRSITYEDKKYHLFPEPKIIQGLTVEELRGLQLTSRKAEYIIGIAKLFTSENLSKEGLLSLHNDEKIIEELIKIRGIGEWTANYTAMKGLRMMNCVPYGDAGINIALQNLKGIDKKNNRLAVENLFNKFDGWKTYLTFYLWRSLRNV